MKFGYRNVSSTKDMYYHLWIAAAKDQVFFQTNLDKALVISLFQKLLSPRSGLKNPHNYSGELNIIAYSLTDFGMNLLLSAASAKAVEDFGQDLLTRYAHYLQEQRTWEILPFDTIFAYDILQDEHEALAISREIHLLHEDWRNDRYSSIGFYLDDRRGDWLSPWRLADLYDNDSIWYQNFLMDEGTHSEASALEFIQT